MDGELCKGPTPWGAPMLRNQNSNVAAPGDALEHTAGSTTSTPSDAGSEDYGVPKKHGARSDHEIGHGNGGAHGDVMDQELDSSDDLFRTPDKGTNPTSGKPWGL